jgi:hypothetical protein
MLTKSPTLSQTRYDSKPRRPWNHSDPGADLDGAHPNFAEVNFVGLSNRWIAKRPYLQNNCSRLRDSRDGMEVEREQRRAWEAAECLGVWRRSVWRCGVGGDGKLRRRSGSRSRRSEWNLTHEMKREMRGKEGTFFLQFLSRIIFN